MSMSGNSGITQTKNKKSYLSMMMPPSRSYLTAAPVPKIPSVKSFAISPF
jgi:hypothetical protein